MSLSFSWKRFPFFDRNHIMKPVALSNPNETKEANPNPTPQSSSPSSKQGVSTSPPSSTPSPSPLLFSPSPTCFTSGLGFLFFGSLNGSVRIVSRSFESFTFSCHDGKIVGVHFLRKFRCLITCGNDVSDQNYSLKFWNMERFDVESLTEPHYPSSPSAAPPLSRVIKIFSKTFPLVPITCFTCLDDMTQCCLGLGNGAVMMLEASSNNNGNLMKETKPKQTLIVPQGKIVTGIHYREKDGVTSLFVVTTDSVTTVYTKNIPNSSASSSSLTSPSSSSSSSSPSSSSLTSANGFPPRLTIDDNGCDLNCSTMNNQHRLVVSNDSAVYFYEAEEKRQAFGFRGEKKLIGWYGNYLILVQEEGREGGEQQGMGIEESSNNNKISSSSSSSSTLSSSSSSPPLPLSLTRDQLTIYDLSNKFIAYQGKMDPISCLGTEWSSIVICTERGEIYQLTEKDLSSKLDLLYKKNLYPIALSLASSAHVDSSYLIDIYKMYGDHLYSKGDYDGSIQQYLETIPMIEPSYVIRKFLDAQRIHNLTSYLSALHERGRANKDHTTLLLNCYTKLKDVEKLEHFLMNNNNNNQSNNPNNPSVNNNTFDVHTAINVCRTAGYFKQALMLCEKFKYHSLYIKIQIEDVGNNPNMALATTASPSSPSPSSSSPLNATKVLSYRSSLSYLKEKMSHKEAESAMRAYGQQLMNGIPEETTMTLMDLCSGWKNESPSSSAASPAPSSPIDFDSLPRSPPDDFLPFFSSHPHHLSTFLERVTQEGKVSTQIWNTLLELYLRQGNEAITMNMAQQNGNGESKGTEEKVGGGRSSTTLNGISSSSSPPVKSVHPNHTKIMNLLKSHHTYDTDQALILCKFHNFEKGILYLYGKLKLYSSIVEYHCQQHQHEKIIKACKKYYSSNPQLWVMALNYFASLEVVGDSQTNNGSDHHDDSSSSSSSPSSSIHVNTFEDEIQQILEFIERLNLLPPLRVIQILCSSPTHKPLAVVKDYLIRSLKNDQQSIISDQHEVSRYQYEIQQMKDDIHKIQSTPTTFQGIKCHACHNSLQLPAVHFLCQHSFHGRCLQDFYNAHREEMGMTSPTSPSASSPNHNPSGLSLECPKCCPEYRRVRDLRESMKVSSTQHDRFFKQLEDSQDGFSTVAEYFGRSLDWNEGKEMK